MLFLTATLFTPPAAAYHTAPITRHARSSRSVVMSATDDLLLGAALQVRQLEQSVTTAKFQAALAPTAAPSIAPSAEVTAASASFLPTLPTLPTTPPTLPTTLPTLPTLPTLRTSPSRFFQTLAG